MLKQKKLLISLFIAGISLLPALSIADAALTIVNNTNEDSTSRVNGGLCSSSLPIGQYAVTKHNSSNPIPQWVIRLACLTNEADCKADIYMGNDDNCSGDPIATVEYNANTNTIIPPIINKSDKYIANGSGSNFSIVYK